MVNQQSLQQQPRYKYWKPPWKKAESKHKDLPTFGDLYINHPRIFLSRFTPVEDAITILNLNQETIYKLRRKFHGNKNVCISIDPFEPLSEISDVKSLEDVVVDVLEAVLRTVEVEGATLGMPIKQVLDLIGIPKCHQSFMEKFLTMPDLNYYSFLILMSVYFDLRPLSKAQLYQYYVEV